MVFNVTNLDKVLLLQTLYAHASPKGLGRIEYSVRAKKGENVVGLTDEECEMILSTEEPDATAILVDYYKGKPIKLDFQHEPNGTILVDSNGYDLSNGRFRFLEALLNVFDVDEIEITKKEYPVHLDDMLDEHTTIPIEEIVLLKNILKHTIKHTDNGTYWKIDANTVDYKPPCMREI